MENKKALEDVLKFVEDNSKCLNPDYFITGCRSILIVEDTKVLNPMLDLIVEEAKERIAFPLTKTRITALAVVVAPKKQQPFQYLVAWSNTPRLQQYQKIGCVFVPDLS